MAATYSEKNGFMFCTWKQNADGDSVFWGDYSPNYEYAKEAFAVRSGLVSKHHLFSENESADILLMPEREYDFGREVAATVNGNAVTAVPATDGYLSLPNVKTMIPTESDNSAAIDLIEINDVTVSFKDGDKPVFTGSVSEDAAYAFRCEWWSLDSDTGILSTEPEWGVDIYNKKIAAFEAGKTYHYGVYVTAYTADISPDAKLKINGREVEHTRIGDENYTQSFWVETNLTMSPISYGHTHNYGTDWKYDSTNHWHECSCGDKSDLTAHSFKWLVEKEATATEKGSKHEECTVCGYKKLPLRFRLPALQHSLQIRQNLRRTTPAIPLLRKLATTAICSCGLLCCLSAVAQ